MSNPLNEDKLKAQFEKMKKKAEGVIDDPDQVKKVAESAWQKAKKTKRATSGSVGTIKADDSNG